MTTSTQSAADRLRQSAEQAKELAHKAGTGQWIVDATDGVITIVGVVDGDPNADNPSDYEGYTDVIAYDVSSEPTAALMAASRVIVPRQASQIEILVEALEEVVHSGEWADAILTAQLALDAALALEVE